MLATLAQLSLWSKSEIPKWIRLSSVDFLLYWDSRKEDLHPLDPNGTSCQTLYHNTFLVALEHFQASLLTFFNKLDYLGGFRRKMSMFMNNNKWHLLSDYPSVEKLLSDWLKKAYYRSSRKTNRALQDVWQKASRFAQLRFYQNKTITGARKITIRGWRKTKELINNSSCFSYLCTMIGTYIVIPNQGP